MFSVLKKEGYLEVEYLTHARAFVSSFDFNFIYLLGVRLKFKSLFFSDMDKLFKFCLIYCSVK